MSSVCPCPLVVVSISQDSRLSSYLWVTLLTIPPLLSTTGPLGAENIYGIILCPTWVSPLLISDSPPQAKAVSADFTASTSMSTTTTTILLALPSSFSIPAATSPQYPGTISLGAESRLSAWLSAPMATSLTKPACLVAVSSPTASLVNHPGYASNVLPTLP